MKSNESVLNSAMPNTLDPESRRSSRGAEMLYTHMSIMGM